MGEGESEWGEVMAQRNIATLLYTNHMYIYMYTCTCS